MPTRHLKNVEGARPALLSIIVSHRVPSSDPETEHIYGEMKRHSLKTHVCKLFKLESISII